MVLFFLGSALATVSEDSLLNSNDRTWVLEPSYEVGALMPFANRIQFGKTGTEFDYVADGGQDNLFRYNRYELNFRANDRHSLRLLFQPFDVTTRQELDRATTFDLTEFPEGTPMEIRYGFDYFRGSYAYDLIAAPETELSLGISMQIRNATLDFRSQDGELQNSNRDIGLVPLLKVRARHDYSNEMWVGFEADGAYAPVKYFNGDVSDVVGALLDTSLKGGLKLKHGVQPFISLRYIGGGAEGTESSPEDGKDGFVSNWLHLGTLSFGAQLR